ncbi:MAG: hypothetical protein HY930_02885 [Euryarchaeota archaeon]|nr:hypothetical protein [Euryarchaeota archaeon]
MAHITLSVPDRLYRKMKEHSEIKWSEIARKAIADYLAALKGKSNSREIIETLPPEVVKALKSVPEEVAKSAYKEMVAEEWKRAKSLTQTS